MCQPVALTLVSLFGADEMMARYWSAVCDEAELSGTDHALLWGRQFLNPYAFEDLQGDTGRIKILAAVARGDAAACSTRAS